MRGIVNIDGLIISSGGGLWVEYCWERGAGGGGLKRGALKVIQETSDEFNSRRLQIWA